METLQNDPTPTPAGLEFPLLAVLKSAPNPRGVWIAPEIPGSLLQVACSRFLVLEPGEVILALVGKQDPAQVLVDLALTSQGMRFPVTEETTDSATRGPKAGGALYPYAGAPDPPRVGEKDRRGILLLNGTVRVPVSAGDRARDFTVAFLNKANDIARGGIEVRPASEADRGAIEQRVAAAERMSDKVREFRRLLIEFRNKFVVTEKPIAAKLFTLACVLVFVVMTAGGVSPFQPDGRDLLAWGANLGPAVVLEKEYWRLFTCMFLHIGIPHLLMNMYALATSGPRVEQMLGRFGFAVTYLVSGMIGSLASIWFHPASLSAGASGAIFGIFGGMMGLVLIRRSEIPAFVLRPLVRGFGVFLVANLAFGLAIPQVDMAAHGGGLLGGIVCGVAFGLTSRAKASTRPLARLIAAGLLVAGTFEAGVAVIRAMPGHAGNALADFTLDPLNDFVRFQDGMRTMVDEFQRIQLGLRGVEKDGKIDETEKPELEKLAKIAATLVERSEAIEARNPDLKQMRALLINIAEHQRDSLDLIVQAFEKPDAGELVTRARESQRAIPTEFERLTELRRRYFAKFGLKEVPAKP